MIRDGGPMPPWTDRIEFGRKYIWPPDLGFWYAELKKGENPVQIFPPTDARSGWYVVVPRTERFEHPIGDNAERRAFAMAEGYITQKQDL
jgi:hypothetical protein